MNQIGGVESWSPNFSASVMSVGNFDGVHLGHQELINQVRRKALDVKLPSVVMTFDPHPIRILYPEKKFKSLFDLSDRVENIGLLKPDFLVVQPFSRDLSELSPREFFEKLLKNACRVKFLFVGQDFNFGKNRQGTLEVLKNLCQQSEVTLTVVEPVKINGETVSSTGIREAVTSGSMLKARLFLGRPYYLKGVVVKGASRGRQIGFATANLFSTAELFLKRGVYLTETSLGNAVFKSVTNVGVNPTFGLNSSLSVETHILNFNQDIYGEVIKVKFLEFIRDEKKFLNVHDLVSQITLDVKMAQNK